MYEVTVPTVNYHINKIFKDSELQKDSVIRKFLITADLYATALDYDMDN